MQTSITIKKYAQLSVVLVTVIVFFIPISTLAQPIKFKIWANTQTRETFSDNVESNGFLDDSFGVQISNNFQNFKSNLALTISQSDKNKSLLFDQSFLEFKTKKNSAYGIGKINRNWSFSKNTSLILSNNARPSDSIYFIKKDPSSNGRLSSWIGPWSFEAFNSILSFSNEVNNPMLLGMRFVLKQYNNLEFELIKTSQWGGSQHSNSLSAFASAIIGNTNESNNANVNQMAGFGVSFKDTINDLPIRTYAQVIGEDESGSLPSCLMGLIGSELSLKSKLFTEIGVEYIDTRIDTTEHGYCGPQTAYSNIDYPYVNYDKTMGTSIDSEGKLYNVWATTEISKNTSIYYAIKNITINDFNSSNHRLSSTKKNGWLTSIGTSWKLNDLNINTNITYQDFHLDKIKQKNGFSFKLYADYSF